MRKPRSRGDQHPVQACCKNPLVNARVQSYFPALPVTGSPSALPRWCEHSHHAEPASVVCGRAVCKRLLRNRRSHGAWVT